MIPINNPNPIPIETRFFILFFILLYAPSDYLILITIIFFLTHLYMIENYLL